MARTTRELNEEAQTLFDRNQELFASGICRLFSLWAHGCVLSHEASVFRSDGFLEELTSQPRYTPLHEMPKAFLTLEEWATRECQLLDGFECAVYAFTRDLPTEATEDDVNESIEEIAVEGEMWSSTLILFAEILLQALLKREGWSEEDLLKWSGQAGGDAPKTSVLLKRLAAISPQSALIQARMADLSDLQPWAGPPYARTNGWMPPLTFDAG